MKINLKDNIFIKGYDDKFSAVYAGRFMDFGKGMELMLYAGKTKDIPEDVAKEIIESKFGDSTINGEPITTYKGYTDITAKSYPYGCTSHLSPRQREEDWINQGRQTSKFYHLTAMMSLLEACKEEYCIIYKHE